MSIKAPKEVNKKIPLWKWADLTVCVKDYKCQLLPEITAAQINQRVNLISLSALRPIYGHGMVIDEIWHYHKQSHCLQTYNWSFCNNAGGLNKGLIIINKSILLFPY